MVYHKEPRLPVDVEYDNCDSLEEKSQPVLHNKDVVQQYMENLLAVKKKLDSVASDNILKAQKRQKKNFENCGRNRQGCVQAEKCENPKIACQNL